MNEYKELILSLKAKAKLKANYTHTTVENTLEYKAANTIEALVKERETSERKLQMEHKLKAIKDVCMSVPDCGVCLLSIGKTCPTKFWHDWTPEEIETAFNIIYGGEIDDGES